MKIMLDSNVYDQIIARDGFSNRLNEAVQRGHIEILKTHIQDDELTRIPDPEKVRAVSEVPGQEINTSGSVWGVSKWGKSCWGDGPADIKFDDIQRGNSKHTNDALIAITAAAQADV
ncbi:MAG: hypothetical protein EXR02_06765 [Rhodospirillales bacterium]|nr:hypothetical protein [Rhodospirillales bacterium]MSP80752.1 hypothetical protein [Rhodospirillales bacterium]